MSSTPTSERKYKHIEKWGDPPGRFPPSYGGADFTNWYVVVGTNRDADVLTTSNFETIKKDLEERFGHLECTDDGEEMKAVDTFSFNHWAVGWIELLLIHESAHEALLAADEWREKLEDYPVADDEDFSRREWDDVMETWKNLSLRERIKYCAECKLSIFAARDNRERGFPEDRDGRLFEKLRTP